MNYWKKIYKTKTYKMLAMFLVITVNRYKNHCPIAVNDFKHL